MNNREEKKLYSGTTEEVFNPSVVGTVRGLFNKQKTYRFQGTRTSTLSSNGSGIIVTSIGLSIANFLEKTALQALFDEIRVRKSEIHLQGYVTAVTGAGNDILAFNPSVLEGTAPSAYTVVARLPGSKIINSSANHKGYIFKAPIFKRPFADITADGSSSVIPYGSFGAWWGYTVTGQTHTVSIAIWTFLLKVDYELRSRA